MKLRIRGNSIRLRLTQSEVVKLAGEGKVEDAVSFGSDDADNLLFRIVADRHKEKANASFNANTITVSLPENTVREWAASDQVRIEGSQNVKNGNLEILIEKDFACLSPRPGEDDADTFTNPLGRECG